ncbi:hypothetical protein JR316_0004374 [Psilocybe cubensis]|uniref:Uncharacterized protein n=2 Tax=Psilocybe cubensis TaxID=181762 RepID=A0ACB8H450_PSICU|nr:hypothetical protein JR316_0004374 [Psilocybe cubensis]KAH9482276.1 hypothetical protein JR316_0004374 [Psilocybe cubensis]
MSPPHCCGFCKTPTDKRCTGCLLYFYCSKKCQKADWRRHLFDCKPKDEITAADCLYKACILTDSTPVYSLDAETRQSYGLSRVGVDNENKMLQLYFYILDPDHLAVKPQILQKWMADGKLAQEIISLFETRMDEATRPKSYLWFLENHHWIFDGNALAPRAESKFLFNTVFQVGWRYSGGSGNPRSALDVIHLCESESWPGHRIECLQFCGQTFCGFHTGPWQKLWVTLGFCTVTKRSRYTDDLLFILYSQLLRECTFQEFVTAYESSMLEKLLEKYGLGLQLPDSPFTELSEFLSSSPNIPSSWWLKHWTTMGGSVTKESYYDYGFWNCRSFQDAHDLSDVYARYFRSEDANPLLLHQARLDGRIFDHISSTILLPNKKKYRKLMKKTPLNSPDPATREWIRTCEYRWNVTIPMEVERNRTEARRKFLLDRSIEVFEAEANGAVDYKQRFVNLGHLDTEGA